jgi:GntR family transcriptional regulator, transcriptional repressor for pyruvate dehydrogenase complex
MVAEGSDPTARVRVVTSPERVLADVAEGILRRGPRPGAAAPSVSDVTGTLGVSRRSASRALAALAAAGIVEADGGGAGHPGPAALSATPVEGIGRLVRLLLRHGDVASGDDLLRLRCDLERAAAAGAALRAGDQDHAALTALIARMRAPGVGFAEFRRLDTAFHVRIARAAGNRLHEQLMQGLRDAVGSRMEQAFSASANWPDVVGRLVREHGRLLDAIRVGRAEDAADLVHEHLAGFYRELGTRP